MAYISVTMELGNYTLLFCVKNLFCSRESHPISLQLPKVVHNILVKDKIMMANKIFEVHLKFIKAFLQDETYLLFSFGRPTLIILVLTFGQILIFMQPRSKFYL